MGNLYEDIFLDFGFEEISPTQFYTELFFNSNAYLRYGDRLQVPLTLSEEDGGTWRSIALRDLPDLTMDRSDAYLSACTYFPHRSSTGHWKSLNGRTHVDQLCAFVVDLDFGDPAFVRQFFFPGADHGEFQELPGAYWTDGTRPKPTFVVCSGRGMHFYYLLETPVPVMKRWTLELEHINRSLYGSMCESRSIDLVVGSVDANLGKRDYHGLTQPYRVVGSLPKTRLSSVSAWRTGYPLQIEELASYAGLDQTSFNVDDFDMTNSLLNRRFNKAVADRTGSKKSKRVGWNPGFYSWLAKREKEHMRLYGEYGHRYNQIRALTIAAVKDRMPREQLVQDVYELYAGWNACAKEYGHPEIAWSECEKAMRSFDRCSNTRKFPKWWMEELCGWEFGTQKRNGVDQADHLAFARAWKQTIYERGLNRKPDGRPKGSGTKADLIRTYAAEHPDANHSEIARALGVSRPTVIKWLRPPQEPS